MRIETERLVIRNMRPEDLDDFHSYRSNPDICRFQSFDPFTIEDSRKFIDSQKDTEFGEPGAWVQRGLERKEDGRLVGDIALKPEQDDVRTVELGVTLNLEFRGAGYAVEAFRGVFDYLFNETKTHRIFGILDTENAGSMKLMENLGFRREAEFYRSYFDQKVNEYRDEYLYAITRDEWTQGNTPAESVRLSLSRDEAVVLGEFLTRFSENDELAIRDQSEKRVLWDLQCVLEKSVDVTGDESYDEILTRARDNIRDA